MSDFFYGDGSGIDFAEAVGWSTAANAFTSTNVETAGSALVDDGGFFGSLGNIFSDVAGAVTQGYQALTQFELAKYQNQFATNQAAQAAAGSVAQATGTAPGFMGVDPKLLMIGGAAVVAILLLRR